MYVDKLQGILLFIIGAAMIAYTSFNYVTNDTVLKVGELSIDKQISHLVQWLSFVGCAILVGGILLAVFKKKQIE